MKYKSKQRICFCILKKARSTHVQERTEMRCEAIYNAKIILSQSLVGCYHVPTLWVKDKHRTTTYLTTLPWLGGRLAPFLTWPSHICFIILPSSTL